MLPLEALGDLIDYTAWSSTRLLDAAAQLSPAELTRDFATADKPVLGTLAHVFGADRVWIERVHGRSPTVFDTEPFRDLAILQREWPPVYARWKSWVAGLTGATAVQEIAYTDLRGNPYRQPAWQIVLHVVNHATHHRGQVSGFLRSMGHAPPQVDQSAFYRMRGKS